MSFGHRNLFTMLPRKALNSWFKWFSYLNTLSRWDSVPFLPPPHIAHIWPIINIYVTTLQFQHYFQMKNKQFLFYAILGPSQGWDLWGKSLELLFNNLYYLPVTFPRVTELGMTKPHTEWRTHCSNNWINIREAFGIIKAKQLVMIIQARCPNC